jgi:ABC-type phosphate/phosphonate transport system permease subunit
VTALTAALGLWQLLTSLNIDLWLRFSQFPTVADVAGAFAGRLSGPAYWTDLTDSLTRVLTGFLVAAVLGVAVGVLVARSHLAEDLLARCWKSSARSRPSPWSPSRSSSSPPTRRASSSSPSPPPSSRSWSPPGTRCAH